MTGWTLLLATHAFAALVCVLLGAYQLVRRIKGDRAHRTIGWTWAAGMLYVATSSFAIRDLRDGQLSLLHVLSLVTLVSLALGVYHAIAGNGVWHRAAMRGGWLGLVAAGVFAVAVPNRHIPTFIVASPLGALAATGAVVGLTAALILLAHSISARPAARAREPVATQLRQAARTDRR